MDTPIYDQLVAELGVSVPDPLDANPLSTLLPVTDAATVTTALPVVRRPVDVPAAMPAVRARPVTEVGGASAEVLDRIDGWCEDRPGADLVNEGGAA